MQSNQNQLSHASYPGFDYRPEELSRFHLSLDSFVISLKNGKIIRFTTDDTEAFLKWLLEHGIKDIR